MMQHNNKTFGVFIRAEKRGNMGPKKLLEMIEEQFPHGMTAPNVSKREDGHKVFLVTLFSGSRAKQLVDHFEKQGFKTWMRTHG